MSVPALKFAHTGLSMRPWVLPAAVLAGLLICMPAPVEAQGFRHGGGPHFGGPRFGGPHFGGPGFRPGGFRPMGLRPGWGGPRPYFHPGPVLRPGWRPYPGWGYRPAYWRPYYRPYYYYGPAYWGGGPYYWNDGYWNAGYPIAAGIAIGAAAAAASHPTYTTVYTHAPCYRAPRRVLDHGRWVRRVVTICYDR